jgi:hypothetical protein
MHITFNNQLLIEVQPILERCFGFSLSSLESEISNYYFRTYQDEANKVILDECRSSGGIDPFLFFSKTNGILGIEIEEGFPLIELKEYLELLFKNDTLTINAAFFISVIYSHNKLKESSIIMDDFDYEENQILVYQKFIRPEMLKLFIALKQPRRKTLNKYYDNTGLSTEITCKFFGNSPIKIDNTELWMEQALLEYLDKYLGVKSIEEAEKELLQLYMKKVGRSDDKETTIFKWGLFQLIKGSSLQGNSKTITSKSAEFILEILKFNNMVDITDLDNIPKEDVKSRDKWHKQMQRNLRSELNYYIKNDLTLDEIIDLKSYKFSPNSGDVRYW